MTWFKVDDSLHSHPKVLATEPAALGLWVIAGSWSSGNLTEGFVPDHVLPRLLPDSAKLARELVAAGLWRRVQGGYTFHDWHDYNPSKEAVSNRRRAAAERQQRWRQGKRNAVTNAPTNSVTHASGNGVSHSSPSRPVTHMQVGEELSVEGGSGGETAERNAVTNAPTPAGAESNAAQAPPKQKRATRIPDDFTVTGEMLRWARENCPSINVARETEKFINYWQSKGGREACKLDWVKTWKNWMLNADERAPRSNGSATAGRRQEQTDSMFGRAAQRMITRKGSA